MFVIVSHFHPSLMFAGKADGYQSEAPYKTHSYGWLQALPLILD